MSSEVAAMVASTTLTLNSMDELSACVSPIVVDLSRAQDRKQVSQSQQTMGNVFGETKTLNRTHKCYSA
jgi:hypothetical protein